MFIAHDGSLVHRLLSRCLQAKADDDESGEDFTKDMDDVPIGEDDDEPAAEEEEDSSKKRKV